MKMALNPLAMFLLLGLFWMAHGQALSEDEKEEILNAHNHYRGQVDPIATNMIKMVNTQYKLVLHINIVLIHNFRNGMKIWPIRLSTGQVHVSTRRMRIATLSPPALIILERVLLPLSATQSIILN